MSNRGSAAATLSAVHAVNDGVRFLLELCALAAIAFAGVGLVAAILLLGKPRDGVQFDTGPAAARAD